MHVYNVYLLRIDKAQSSEGMSFAQNEKLGSMLHSRAHNLIE